MPPTNRFERTRRLGIFLGFAVSSVLFIAALHSTAAQNSQSSTARSPASSSQSSDASSHVPHGKKLFLKDGNFLMVREYEVEGDRVRYYNTESSAWEVMPANLIDWEATKKAEADEKSRDATLLSKVHSQEEGRIVQPLDIDASLEVAPGVFLPPGHRLFVYDGKSVYPLPQAETDSKVSKGRLLEQVLIPVPIVPSRQNVSINGAHSELRLQIRQPEFYFRPKDTHEPVIALIRAKVHGDGRLIENVDTLFGEHHEVRDELEMQKWLVAGGVYRFTVSKPLQPGEYAIAQQLEDQGMSLYVWDFGIDDSAAGKPK
jgi:hypothetical protein